MEKSSAASVIFLTELFDMSERKVKTLLFSQNRHTFFRQSSQIPLFLNTFYAYSEI